MTKSSPSPKQDQPDDEADKQVAYTGMGAPRRVSVKACQGKDATVVVTVVQGTVWMSITPPFTWEAILEPGMVDEVIRMLRLAREEAMRWGRRAFLDDEGGPSRSAMGS
ncbi:MAG: hypothetical protein ACRDS9_26435 [Pseudonocardiaceae bacterium]